MGRITLNGFYRYDPTLFDGAPIPEGMDKPTVIRYIMKTSGDLYPWHQSLPDLKQNIADWFTVNEFNFGKIWEAYHSEFGILDNVDRYEDIKDTVTSGGADTTSMSNQASGSDSSDSLAQGDTSAFNSDQYEPATQQSSNTTATYGRKDESTATTEYGRTGETVHTAHIHGNIGVTTSEQLIESAVKMYSSADVYKRIAQMFEAEFLIQLY